MSPRITEIVRYTHLATAILLGVFVYSTSDESTAATLTKALVFPLLTATGAALWIARRNATAKRT